jgi:hypothetical protein
MNCVASGGLATLHVIAVRLSVYSLQQDAFMPHTKQFVKGTSQFVQKKRTTCPHAIEVKWQKCCLVFLQVHGRAVLTTNKRGNAHDMKKKNNFTNAKRTGIRVS